MIETFDATPTTGLLRAIMANKPKLHILLGEALDNSFDQSAKNIVVEVSDEEISISDDGNGITRDRAEALVRLGEHLPTATTALGRYGVGIKYQALAAGGRMNVASTSKDGRMLLFVDWDAMVAARSWECPRARWLLPWPLGACGTKITIGSLHHRPFRHKDLDQAKSEIVQRFYPALADGCSIRFNGEALAPEPDPEISDEITGLLEITPEKRARVRAGMLVNTRGRLHGVQVGYKHRIILPRSTFGCNNHPTAGLFARVQLDGPWDLSTFKDDLDDENEAELEEQVFKLLLPLLEKCKSAFMTANVLEMQERLNSLLPSEISVARPERVRELNRKGEKKGRTGIVRDVPPVKSGPARLKVPPQNQIMIEFVPVFHRDGYGFFAKGSQARASRIVLARDNPHVERLLAKRDKAAERELYLIAMAIYLNAKTDQLELPFDGASGHFGLQLWKLLNHQNIIDDESAAA